MEKRFIDNKILLRFVEMYRRDIFTYRNIIPIITDITDINPVDIPIEIM